MRRYHVKASSKIQQNHVYGFPVDLVATPLIFQKHLELFIRLSEKNHLLNLKLHVSEIDILYKFIPILTLAEKIM